MLQKKIEYDFKIIITLKAQKHNVESRKRMELIENDQNFESTKQYYCNKITQKTKLNTKKSSYQFIVSNIMRNYEQRKL